MIKGFLSKYRSNVDANTSEYRVINNIFLFNAYMEIYALMSDYVIDGGKILEVGGAGGVAKEFNRDILVTDIRESNSVDLIASAENLPFAAESFDAVWEKDALHHLTQPNLFFAEVLRVLKPGGTLSICEPYWSVTGKFIYKFIHPEVWSVRKIRNKEFTQDGNQALAYCVFKVMPSEFELLHENFQVESVHVVNGISWMLSGGATLTTRIPQRILHSIKKFETNHKSWMKKRV